MSLGRVATRSLLVAFLNVVFLECALPSQMLEDLATGLNNDTDIVTESARMDEVYEHVRFGISLYSPSAFIAPSTTQEIAHMLQVASQYDTKVAIRSEWGGSYIGQSTLGSEGIVVSMKRFKNVETVPTEKAGMPHAKIGAGISMAELYALVYEAGYIFPGARGGIVGAGGLLPIGGLGDWNPFYGFSCDSVISARMVVEIDGRWTEVSVDDSGPYRDLMFAVRGGMGGNYGVITEFTVQLYPIPRLISYGMIWVGDKNFTNGHSDLERHVRRLTDLEQEGVAVKEEVQVFPDRISIYGTCLCDPESCSQCLGVSRGMVQDMQGWANGGSWAHEGDVGDVLFKSCPGGKDVLKNQGSAVAGKWCLENFAWGPSDIYHWKKSVFTTYDIIGTVEGLRVLQEAMDAPEPGFLEFDSIGFRSGPGSGPITGGETSFLHRLYGFSLQTLVGGPEWAKRAWRLVDGSSASLNRSCQGYIDDELVNWFERYYPDPAVRTRLMSIKCKYNPRDIFGGDHVRHMQVPYPEDCAVPPLQGIFPTTTTTTTSEAPTAAASDDLGSAQGLHLQQQAMQLFVALFLFVL